MYLRVCVCVCVCVEAQLGTVAEGEGSVAGTQNAPELSDCMKPQPGRGRVMGSPPHSRPESTYVFVALETHLSILAWVFVSECSCVNY